ncbi:hypothetical protein LX32DRAFT_619627 [Colletotrichum zoysiae]|uniref:Uncharacterized protein n=1 Tax=Colletotrichum zoysiae TaxID=1216348 RepID=A0AAD9M3V3_9PEZI|nr:hypothetical protein LX32DRAFT_619627 [Colletotrichum zoysiae]
MQWADLRGLSSSTRRGVSRMTATAARQRLPLLLPPRAPAQRWRDRARAAAGEVRPFSAAAGQRTDKPSRTRQPKPKPPSLFEELFPDEDLLAIPKRGGDGQHRRGGPNTSSRDEGGGKVKVRFLTSRDAGKPDTTEYNQRMLGYRQKCGHAEGDASSAAIVDFLGSRARARAKKGQAGGGGGDGPSLFNELFSTRDPGAATAGRRKRAEQHLSEDRHVNHDDLRSWLDSLPKGEAATAADAAATATSPTSLPDPAERPAVLVLSNASPNLQESDFYRIGPQGHHLEGWSSSIRKVMQAYDYGTLEPMGCYFILFDSYAAAESYQKEAQRRQAAVRRSLLSAAAPLAYSSLAAAEGGPATPPSAFTLAPPSTAPLSLHIYKLRRKTEARLGTYNVHSLLSMTPEPPPRANSHVILSVDGGTVDQRMLTTWLRRDARERNLGWPVQHMRPYFAPKVNRRTAAAAAALGEAREVHDDDDADDDYDDDEEELGWRDRDDNGDGDFDNDAPPPLVGAEGQQQQQQQRGGRGGPDENALSARFVLSFPDVHEARRFVRAWHRREFVLTNGSAVVLNTYVVCGFFIKITCNNIEGYAHQPFTGGLGLTVSPGRRREGEEGGG